MNAAQHRAWRFDFEAGITLSPGGRIQMVDGDASVRQAILLLLSTIPGERVMRPDYGCDLHRLVFSRTTTLRPGWPFTSLSRRCNAGSLASRSFEWMHSPTRIARNNWTSSWNTGCARRFGPSN